jgi:hypothetical protein
LRLESGQAAGIQCLPEFKVTSGVNNSGLSAVFIGSST